MFREKGPVVEQLVKVCFQPGMDLEGRISAITQTSSDLVSKETMVFERFMVGEFLFHLLVY